MIAVSCIQASDTNTTTHSCYYKGELTHLIKVADINQTTTDENNETNITVKNQLSLIMIV